MSQKLRTVIFWAVLASGVGLGAPYDPRQTEDIVRIMNETKIEVVLEKGEGPPEGYDIETIRVGASRDDARGPEITSHERAIGVRLRRFSKLS